MLVAAFSLTLKNLKMSWLIRTTSTLGQKTKVVIVLPFSVCYWSSEGILTVCDMTDGSDERRKAIWSYCGCNWITRAQTLLSSVSNDHWDAIIFASWLWSLASTEKTEIEQNNDEWLKAKTEIANMLFIEGFMLLWWLRSKLFIFKLCQEYALISWPKSTTNFYIYFPF